MAYRAPMQKPGEKQKGKKVPMPRVMTRAEGQVRLGPTVNPGTKKVKRGSRM